MSELAFFASVWQTLEATVKADGVEVLLEKENAGTGLVNQGATCYLNSLVQSLFHVTPLREAVFAWRYDPSMHGGNPAECIPLQLQRLFARLALSGAPFVPTSTLTSSFGWEGEDAFLQHDVQELCRVLFEALSLSDTTEGGFAHLLPALFGGRTVDVLACTACGHGRTREEQWQDISLPVEGMEPGGGGRGVAAARLDMSPPSTEEQPVGRVGGEGPCSAYTGLHAALRSLSAPEVLEGANAWHCDGCGGKSSKAVKAAHLGAPLPPVLTLHLRRFGFDHTSGRYTKVNDPFSFPMLLPGGMFTGGGDEGEGAAPCPDYELSAVLLHSGGATGGHYFAFVRPDAAVAATMAPPGTEASSDGAGEEVDEHDRESAAVWALANDTGLTLHTGGQVAGAIGVALPPVVGTGASPPTHLPAPKVPTGSTPYLLLYRQRRGELGASPPPPRPALALPAPTSPLLARQYAYAAALGAGLLPHAEQSAVQEENEAWSVLSRAVSLRPSIARLLVHVPVTAGAPDGGAPLLPRRVSPHPPVALSPTALPVFVRTTDTVEAATDAVFAAWRQLPSSSSSSSSTTPLSRADVRLRLFDPAGARLGQPLSSPSALSSNVAAAGLAPSAVLMLETRPPSPPSLHHPHDGEGWPAWHPASTTLRVLPWGAHAHAVCAAAAAAACGDGAAGVGYGGGGLCCPSLWGEGGVLVAPTLQWDGEEGVLAGPATSLLHATVVTLVPSVGGSSGGAGASHATSPPTPALTHLLTGLAAALPPPLASAPPSSKGVVHAIIVPGGLPSLQEMADGRASARLRARTSPPSSSCTRTGGHAAPGGLRVLSIPIPLLASIASMSVVSDAGVCAAVIKCGAGGLPPLATSLDKGLGCQDGDDVVLLLDKGAGGGQGGTGTGLDAALTAIRALFTTAAVRIEVVLSPGLSACMAAGPSTGIPGPSAAQLAVALTAWAAAVPGAQLTLPSHLCAHDGAEEEEGAGSAPHPHWLYCANHEESTPPSSSSSSSTATSRAGGKGSGVGKQPPTAAARPSIPVTARRDDTLSRVKARALATALGGSLVLPATPGSVGVQATGAPPDLPVHFRRGARSPMFRTEDEADGRTLANLDIGDGATLLLCPGPALPSSTAVLRVWSWVGGGSGAESSSAGFLALVTSVPVTLATRVSALKKAVHAALKADGLLSILHCGGEGGPPGLLTPGHLRLRTRASATAESALLRDDAVLRSAVPAPASGTTAVVQALRLAARAVTGHVSISSSSSAPTLSFDPSLHLAPLHVSTTADDRDVVLQLLSAPESIGRDDLIVRVRQLVCPPSAGGAKGLPPPRPGAAMRPEDAASELTLLAELHAVAGALGLWAPDAPQATCHPEDTSEWLPCIGLPTSGDGPSLSPPEEVVIHKATGAGGIAAALARHVTPAQLALLQLSGGLTGCAALAAGAGAACDALLPLPIRLAKLSAHGPAVTVYDATRLATWHGPLLVRQEGQGGEGGVDLLSAYRPTWADVPVVTAPLCLTDGCTLLWRCDPCPLPTPVSASAVATTMSPAAAGATSGGDNKENECARGGEGVSGSGARAVAAARRASQRGDTPTTSSQRDGGSVDVHSPPSAAPGGPPVKPWLVSKGRGAGGQGGQGGGASAPHDVLVLAGKPPPSRAAAAGVGAPGTGGEALKPTPVAGNGGVEGRAKEVGVKIRVTHA